MFGWLRKLFSRRHASENLDEGHCPKSGAKKVIVPSCVTVERFGPITVVAFLPDNLGPDSQNKPESRQIQDKVNEVFEEVSGVCRQASGVVLLDFTQINSMGTTATAALHMLANSVMTEGKEIAVCSLPAIPQGVLDLLWADRRPRVFHCYHNRLEAILTLLRLHSALMGEEERESLVENLFQQQFACRECAAEFQITQAMLAGPQGPVFVCPQCNAFLLPQGQAVRGLFEEWKASNGSRQKGM